MGRSALVAGFIAAASLLAVPAWADCVIPGPAPVLPRGEVATHADMKIAHDALQTYVNALESYQTCLEKQITAAPPDTKPELKLAWRAQGNAAIDVAKAASARYAEQYKIFKARQPPPKQN